MVERSYTLKERTVADVELCFDESSGACGIFRSDPSMFASQKCSWEVSSPLGDLYNESLLTAHAMISSKWAYESMDVSIVLETSTFLYMNLARREGSLQKTLISTSGNT